MTDLPAPLVPPEVDLRDFEFMPLSVRRFRDSDLVSLESAEAIVAAILLWGASWHQLPAGSLPDDNRVLANLAGFGRAVGEWQRIREGALRGFVKCADGRLYHPVVVEKVMEAWQGKLRQRWKTYLGTLKKHCQRKKIEYQPPTFDEWKEQGQPTSVPSQSDGCPEGQVGVSSGTNAARPQNVPGDNASKGEGEGEGEGQGELNNSLSAAADNRLEIPGLAQVHPIDWQPDPQYLATELQRQGVPMPNTQALAKSLRRFNVHHEGKPLTLNQQYSKLADWLEGDYRRDQQRPATPVQPAASSAQPARKLTPVEQAVAANRQYLIDNGIDPDGPPPESDLVCR